MNGNVFYRLNVMRNLSLSLLLLAVASCFVFSSCSEEDNNAGGDVEPNRTVNVKTAGSLQDIISEDEMYKITELKVSGVLNGTDILMLRKMAGSGEKGQITGGMLSHLDMSDAKIVSGGDAYYEYQGRCYTDYDIIGEYMFYNCQSLRTIELPNSAKEIDEYAFEGCDNLKSITLPINISKLSEHSLYTYTENMKDPAVAIHILATEPPALSEYENVDGLCVLFVPKGSRDKYLASAWNEVFDYILEEGAKWDDYYGDDNDDDEDDNEDDTDDGLSIEEIKAFYSQMAGAYNGGSGIYANKIYFYNDTITDKNNFNKVDSLYGANVNGSVSYMVTPAGNDSVTVVLNGVSGRVLAKEIDGEQHKGLKEAIENAPAQSIRGQIIMFNIQNQLAYWYLYPMSVEYENLEYDGETHDVIISFYSPTIGVYGVINTHRVIQLPLVLASVWVDGNEIVRIYNTNSQNQEEYMRALLTVQLCD